MMMRMVRLCRLCTACVLPESKEEEAGRLALTGSDTRRGSIVVRIKSRARITKMNSITEFSKHSHNQRTIPYSWRLGVSKR